MPRTRASARVDAAAPDAALPAAARTSVFTSQLIRASAGTGKTYELSGRYIERLRSSTPEQILAVTFTRAAAGEILERVLLRLSEAALDPQRLEELAQQVRRPSEAPLTRDDCLALLEVVTRDLHRVRISTLDSFFIQLAQSLSLELELSPGWSILDDVEQSRLEAQAVERLFQNHPAEHLRPLLNLLSKGDARRAFLDTLRQTVREYYEVHLSTADGAWHKVPEPHPLAAEKLRQAIEDLELARCQLPDLKSWSDVHSSSIDAAWDGDWEKFLSKGIGAAVFTRSQTYKQRDIPPAVAAAYQALIPHARAVILREFAGRNRATRDLLNHLDAELRLVKGEHEGLTFSDVTRAVGQGWRSGALERFEHRLDSAIEHLLLDEFQDTNILQWQAIAPLAQQVAARQHTSLFCVGDQKQAIYGWRGGVAELFDAVQQIPHVESASLACSYRSAPAVIDAVNRVCQHLHRHPGLGDAEPAVRRWQERFDPHATARQDAPGCVSLETSPDSDDEVTFDFAARRVVELHRTLPGRTIGVLCKTNQAVADLSRRIRRLGIEVSEEGRSTLSDNVPVTLLCSLLRLADHPGDSAARFHVATSPLAGVVGLPESTSPVVLERFAERIRRELLEQGYGGCLERWARGLASHCDSRGVDRLRQLVHLACDYDAHATLRPADFVEFVDANPALQPAPAPVRVMTIHHSKGLEFDVVVLPELNQQTLVRHPNFVTGHPASADPPDTVLRYVNELVQSLLSDELQQIFQADYERRVEEQLCNLYVAMTRARHALHLIVHPVAAKSKSLNWANLLRAALLDNQALPADRSWTISGTPDWWKQLPAGERAPRKRRTKGQPPAEAPAPLTIRLAAAAAPCPFDREPLRPSRHRTRRAPLSEILKPEQAGAMTRGTLLHAWCEQIEWLDDGPPDPDRLRRIARAVGPGEVNVERTLAEFQRMLAVPEIAAVFSRAAYHAPQGLLVRRLPRAAAASSVALRVRREQRFIVPEDDQIVRGCIDRLVLLERDGQVVAADVVDFKSDVFDGLNPAAVEERRADYREQLQQYVRAVSHLYHLPAERIGAHLVYLAAGQVESVE